VGIGEALRIDKPYKWKVVLCWEGGSKSAGGGVMKGDPLKDWEVLVMGSDVRGNPCRKGNTKRKYMSRWDTFSQIAVTFEPML
jgi:hypothetical protein